MRTFPVLLFSLLQLVYAAPKANSNHNSASSQIEWKTCEPNLPGLECGQLNVPLDWSNPGGQQITIGINRLKASDSSSKIGSLIFNPGGPGGSATKYCQIQAQNPLVFSETTNKYFDIICPDPRGVASSTPIQCDPNLWNQRLSLLPKDQASYTELLRRNEAFGQSCLDLSGDIVKHVDTTSVARDMEAIRVALGDGKLNWLGLSYGTMIGLQYAELFPGNIRAMVLDGVVDHSATELYTLFAESEAYERELGRFFDWCKANATCALHGQDVAQIFDNLVAQAQENPIPAPGCLKSAGTQVAGQCFDNVTGEDILFNVQGSAKLTNKDPSPISLGWPLLGQALNESLHGNATLLSSVIASSQNSTVWQGLAVGCIDWLHSTKSFGEIERKQFLMNATSPHTMGGCQSWQYQTQCLGWPAPLQNPQHLLNQTAMRLAPPLLMVNSIWDPEASYIWAQNALSQAPTATMVTRYGDGHLTYPLGGEGTRLIEAYLINGTLPQNNLVIQS